MSIPESDNRIQFPPTPVDFDNVVGTTGQLHDSFPAGGQAPRYDWMRMVLIGLLANQSSADEPTQRRTGTTWFNRTKDALEIFTGSGFVDLAQVLELAAASTDGSTAQVTLASWYADVKAAIASIRPRFTFSGISSADSVSAIPVPQSIQDAMAGIVDDLHPLVYVEGILVDPRLTRFSAGCPSLIQLLGDPLSSNDKFTVVIERFDLMISEDVVA